MRLSNTQQSHDGPRGHVPRYRAGAARHRRARARRRSTTGASRSSAPSASRWRCWPTSSPTATTSSPPCCAIGPGARRRARMNAPWRETPMTLVAPGTDEWTAVISGARRLGWHEFAVDGLGRPVRDVAEELEAEGRRGTGREPRTARRRACWSARRPRGPHRSGVTAGDASWLDARADALAASTPIAERVNGGAGRATRRRRCSPTPTAGMRRIIRPVAALGGPRARAVRRVVRDVPALGRPRPDAQRARSARPRRGCRTSRTSASTCSTCRRSTRSATASARDRNNTLRREAGRPGQPVGDRLGGGRAHRDRTGPRHARRLRRASTARRERLGLEIALDLAWQCSPDHPWVREHPEWFRHRPDGTIKYAENPPKKYQDIYPIDFECDDWRGALAGAARRHPLLDRRAASASSASTTRTPSRSRFWEWLIAQVHAEASGRHLPGGGVHAARS